MRKFVFLDCFESSSQENIAFSVSMRKSYWKSHVPETPKPTKFLNLNEFSLSSRTKKVSSNFSETNFKDFLTQYSKIQIRFWMNVIGIRSPTARAWKFHLLSILTERNSGLTLGGNSVFSVLGGPTTLKIWLFRGRRVPPLKSRARLNSWAVVSCSAWQLLEISAQTGYSTPFRCSFPRSISNRNVLLEGQVLSTCSSNIIILVRTLESFCTLKFFQKITYHPVAITQYSGTPHFLTVTWLNFYGHIILFDPKVRMISMAPL